VQTGASAVLVTRSVYILSGILPGRYAAGLFSAPLPTAETRTVKMTDERRRQDRFTVCLDATWHGRAGKNGARVVDLSEGGCYIDSIVEVAESEPLTLGLMMPDGKWLVLKGEVAHRTPRLGFGVRFVGLTDGQKEKLDFLLKRAKGEDKSEEISFAIPS